MPSLKQVTQASDDVGSDLGKWHRAQVSLTYGVVTGTGAGTRDELATLREAEADGRHTDFTTDDSFTSSKRTSAVSAQLRVTLTQSTGDPAVLVELDGI